MPDEIDLKGLIDRNTGIVYVDIDAIIMWLYTANVNHAIVESFLSTIAVVLQEKKEKIIEKDSKNLKNGNRKCKTYRRL